MSTRKDITLLDASRRLANASTPRVEVIDRLATVEAYATYGVRIARKVVTRNQETGKPVIVRDVVAHLNQSRQSYLDGVEKDRLANERQFARESSRVNHGQAVVKHSPRVMLSDVDKDITECLSDIRPSGGCHRDLRRESIRQALKEGCPTAIFAKGKAAFLTRTSESLLDSRPLMQEVQECTSYINGVPVALIGAIRAFERETGTRSSLPKRKRRHR